MKKNRPPLSEVEAADRGIKVDRDGLVRCRVCGCTEREACCPPCSWMRAPATLKVGAHAEIDLCSMCYEAAAQLTYWLTGAHRPSKAALWREVARLRAVD